MSELDFEASLGFVATLQIRNFSRKNKQGWEFNNLSWPCYGANLLCEFAVIRIQLQIEIY